ncbi:hypothetical protein HPP92_009891 [Vanilla planifolia]|uniref:Uncharacterized protein n=1 Tax=Vanilla planifolia TaxID=51239 RepID=A0A835V1B5_VANPL|nr:hypothetical protein HPP92_009891 [Vanilla planifolia]
MESSLPLIISSFLSFFSPRLLPSEARTTTIPWIHPSDASGGRGLQWRLHNLHLHLPHQGIPHVKNASAQAYAFKAQATVTNTMDKDLKQWRSSTLAFSIRRFWSRWTARSSRKAPTSCPRSNGTTFAGSRRPTWQIPLTRRGHD